MRKSSVKIIHHFRSLLHIKKTERLWHFPLLAAVCIGSCLLIGWVMGRPSFGNLASLGALSILYFTWQPLRLRMQHLLLCSVGLVLSYSIGLVLGFSRPASVMALGFVTFVAQVAVNKFRVPPPGNFFFLMLCAVATSTHYDAHSIPIKIAIVAMGSVVSLVLALFYSVLIGYRVAVVAPHRHIPLDDSGRASAFILAVFLAFSLAAAFIFRLATPYWVCISTIAIIQGGSISNVWERSSHRVLGTFIGIGITYLILMGRPAGIGLIVIISLLQYMVEAIIVRNYGMAVIFITPLTILLAENGSGMTADIDVLIGARLLDTLVGSCIGLVAGWCLHNDEVVYSVQRGFNKLDSIFGQTPKP